MASLQAAWSPPEWVSAAVLNDTGMHVVRLVLSAGGKHLAPFAGELVRLRVVLVPFVLEVEGRPRAPAFPRQRNRYVDVHAEDVAAFMASVVERARPHVGGRVMALLGIGTPELIQVASAELPGGVLSAGWLAPGEGGVAWRSPGGKWVRSGAWEEVTALLQQHVLSWPEQVPR